MRITSKTKCKDCCFYINEDTFKSFCCFDTLEYKEIKPYQSGCKSFTSDKEDNNEDL